MQTQNQTIDAMNPDLSRPEICTGERILLLAKLFANRKARTLALKIGIPQRPLYPLRMGFQKSARGSPFLLSHALHCPKAGYPIIRHNEKRDIFANVMKKVGHQIFTNSTSTEDQARLDISAKRICGSRFERSFSYAPTNRIKNSKDAYLLHENLKRLNIKRIVDIEHGSFSTSTFATAGGASPSHTNSSDALLPS